MFVLNQKGMHMNEINELTGNQVMKDKDLKVVSGEDPRMLSSFARQGWYVPTSSIRFKVLFLKSCKVTVWFLPLSFQNLFSLFIPVQPGSGLVQPGFIRFFSENFRFNRNFKFRFYQEFTKSSLLNTTSTSIRACSTRICAVSQNQPNLICGGYKNLHPPLLNPI